MIAKLFKEKVKFDGRGVGMNPTQAYDEFYELVGGSDNFTVNTPLHPKNVSHANRFKHDYLTGHPNVQFHNISLDIRMFNFTISSCVKGMKSTSFWRTLTICHYLLGWWML